MSSSMFSSPTPLSSTASSVTANQADDGIIFSQEMTVHLKGSSSIASQNVKQLNVEVITSRFNEIRREIEIRISDQIDLFFSFIYLVDSDEFSKIKGEHSLVIPFEEFPKNLKALLEKCARTQRGANLTQDQSSYILRMEYVPRTNMKLEIVERNELRHIPHLSFTLPAASEEYIRSKFSETCHKLRRENEALRDKNALLETDVRTLSQTNEQAFHSYNQDLVEKEKSAQEKTREMERKLREEKDKFLETERTLKLELSTLKRELQTAQESRDDELQKSGRNYSDLKDKYNQELSRKSARIKELEERTKQLTSEQEYQKGLREKTNQILQKNETELGATKKDLSKANEIIRKLQEEVKSSREKVAILNQVTHKQEASLGMRQSTIDKVSCDLKICLQQLEKKKKEIDQLETDLERCRSKCSQSELQIKANKAVISKLSEQLELKNKLIAKMQIEAEQREEQQTEPLCATTNSSVPKHLSPSKYDRDGRIPHSGQQEVLRKKSSLLSSSRAQTGVKNVDFLLDDEPITLRSKTRADFDEMPDMFELDHNLKNHLFTHIKEKPQLREVNLRTNHRTKVGSSSSANVVASSRKTHLF